MEKIKSKEWLLKPIDSLSFRACVGLFRCDSGHKFIDKLTSMKKNKVCPLCEGWHYLSEYDNTYQGKHENLIPITLEAKLWWKCKTCYHTFKEFPLTYVRTNRECIKCFKMREKENLHDDSYNTKEKCEECEVTESDGKRRSALEKELFSLKKPHKIEILKEKDLKSALGYLIEHKVPSQSYGTLIEEYIIVKHRFTKNNVKDCNGDASKNGKNYEIKVSLGGKTHNKFNFVQVVRTTHKVDYYLLVAFHLTKENLDNYGEVYIFMVPSSDMNRVVGKFGSYAHGTKDKLGKISEKHISIRQDKEIHSEHAIRPKYGSKCWKVLLSYRINEFEI